MKKFTKDSFRLLKSIKKKEADQPDAMQGIERIDEGSTLEELEQKIRKRKNKKRVWICSTIGAIAAITIGVYLIVTLTQYHNVKVLDVTSAKSVSKSNYIPYLEGVVRYSKDGAVYLSVSGEEKWNQAYQMNNPVADVCSNTVAVADSGGNDIMVFDKNGLKGEIHTNLPIEKISISGQGIVSVIMKNEDSPQVVCYDAAGNLLVENDVSLSDKGYPVDIALSEDGNTLLTSYLSAINGTIKTNISYLNFAEAGQTSDGYEMLSVDYENVIIPEVFFIEKDKSVLVGEHSFLIYQGIEKPKKQKEIQITKEIRQVFHSEEYIGFLLKENKKSGYELRLYDANGTKVLSQKVQDEYTNVRVEGEEVIMFDGQKCSIYTKNGVHRFEGEMNVYIYGMLPVSGINKYMVMSPDGIQTVRLKR